MRGFLIRGGVATATLCLLLGASGPAFSAVERRSVTFSCSITAGQAYVKLVYDVDTANMGVRPLSLRFYAPAGFHVNRVELTHREYIRKGVYGQRHQAEIGDEASTPNDVRNGKLYDISDSHGWSTKDSNDGYRGDYRGLAGVRITDGMGSNPDCDDFHDVRSDGGR